MGEAEPGITAGERRWQNEVGGPLQQKAYARAGTREVLDRQHRRIVALIAPTPGMRVLDLGCGVGHLLTWLTAHAPARYHGLDLSLNSLRAARSAGLRDLSVGDAEHLPFRDASYDRVVCNGAAHHLPDLRAALCEVRRVLRPGGRLVLHEPVDSAVTGAIRQTLLRRSPYESPADLAHKHAFTKAVVEQTLRETGFTEITATSHDFLAYPLSGMYMALPWSRSRRTMRALIGLERCLDRVAFLKPVWNALAWRVLFTARRPS
jgi:ubiquinone/menaquinone biosynthesis C-methylase UbiE